LFAIWDGFGMPPFFLPIHFAELRPCKASSFQVLMEATVTGCRKPNK
jgi:hypothetical protein